MSAHETGYFCANHPGVTTRDTCADCGRPFCENCLTELWSRRLCGWCRDTRISATHVKPSCNPKVVVLWARIFNVTAFFLTLGGTLLVTFLVAVGNAGPGGAAMTASDRTTAFVAAGVITLFLSVVFLIPAAGLSPGRGWLWVWQWIPIVLFALASVLTCAALIALSVVLGIYWIKPEVRAYLDGATP